MRAATWFVHRCDHGAGRSTRTDARRNSGDNPSARGGWPGHDRRRARRWSTAGPPPRGDRVWWRNVGAGARPARPGESRRCARRPRARRVGTGTGSGRRHVLPLDPRHRLANGSRSAHARRPLAGWHPRGSFRGAGHRSDQPARSLRGTGRRAVPDAGSSAVRRGSLGDPPNAAQRRTVRALCPARCRRDAPARPWLVRPRSAPTRELAPVCRTSSARCAASSPHKPSRSAIASSIASPSRPPCCGVAVTGWFRSQSDRLRPPVTAGHCTSSTMPPTPRTSSNPKRLSGPSPPSAQRSDRALGRRGANGGRSASVRKKSPTRGSPRRPPAR